MDFGIVKGLCEKKSRRIGLLIENMVPWRKIGVRGVCVCDLGGGGGSNFYVIA